MAPSVPTVAQGSCSMLNVALLVTEGKITVLLHKRLGTKEPALFPFTISSLQKIIYYRHYLILLNETYWDLDIFMVVLQTEYCVIWPLACNHVYF